MICKLCYTIQCFCGSNNIAIANAKRYSPAVALSIQDNPKLLQQLKSGYKRTINWNKQKQPPEMIYKKVVIENSAKFIWKHLHQSLFFSKDAGLRHATLLKRRLWQRCFPINFAKFSKTTFLQNESRRLLPNKYQSKISTQEQNWYLDFLINSNFQEVSRLFLLSFLRIVWYRH